MFKKIIEQRDRLAVFTTVILILESILLPNGWMGSTPMARAAESYNWTFTNEADYTLDASLMLSAYGGGASSALHFKIQDFASSSLGAGLEGISATIQTLICDSGNTLWGIADNQLWSSTDGGANWTQVVPSVGMVLYDILENDYAGDGIGGANLIAVGSRLGAPATAYSFDGGSSWALGTPPVIPMGAIWVAVTYDTATDTAYATDDIFLAVIKSSDGGATWSSASPGIGGAGVVTNALDIVAYGANSVAVLGEKNDGSGAINFTTNGGTTWTSTTLPGSPTDITVGGFIGGVFYALGNNYLIKNNIGGGGVMGNPGAWTNITANLNDGTYASDAYILGGISTDIVYIKARTGADYTLFSSIDSGQTFNQHYADPNATKMSGGIALNPNGDTMFWGGITPADTYTDIYSATVAPTHTSVIAKVGPTNVGTITDLAYTLHALNLGEPKIAFGNNITDAGPWYYWDGVEWLTSTTDDYLQSTPIWWLTAGLGDPTVLASLPINGTIYVKIYTPTTNATIILDNLAITYDVLTGGPNQSTDQTAPSSRVDTLPSIIGQADVPNYCAPMLTVTATAADNLGGSGIASVTLFVSENSGSFVAFGEPDLSQPWEWSVPVNNDRLYAFYTIAVDRAVPPNTESPPMVPDTTTRTDFQAPTVTNTIPQNSAVNVPVGQSVVFTFSEPMDSTTFAYLFYRIDDGETPVEGMTVNWNANTTSVTVSHTDLDYDAVYRFEVTNATDLAGNQLNDVTRCFFEAPPPPGCDRWYLPWENGPRQCKRPIPQPPTPPVIIFTTQPAIDPDLLSSTLTVADGPNADGSYNPADLAEYTLHLVNRSSYPASTTVVTIMFEPGLTFVEAIDARFRTIEEGGKVVGLEWNGSVPGVNDPGHIIDAQFVMRVNSPAINLTITQTGSIFDGVHTPFLINPPAILQIARHPKFDDATLSGKTVDKDEAQHGDVLFYTITIKNTGTTIADVEFSDFVPKESNPDGIPPFFYKPSSARWDYTDTRWSEAPHYDEVTQTLHGVARDVLPNADTPALWITFEATVRGGVYDTNIINTANVWDPNLGFNSDTKATLTAKTHVPGGPPPPLQVAYQSPPPTIDGNISDNNALKQNIKIGFNSEVNLTQPFEISMTEAGTAVNIEDWLPSWSEWNLIPNSMLTLFPPGGELAVGAIYEITISDGTNKAGGKLLYAPVVWSFVTAAPTLRITSPTDPVYEMRANQPSDLFTITLFDEISNEQYVAEEDIGIGLTASYMNDTPRTSGWFLSNSGERLTQYGNESKITIQKGTSTASFKYFDTKVTGPEVLKISTFEDPYRGWVDDFKYVTVVDNQPANSLTLTVPEKATLGQQATITVRATNENGRPMSIPPSRLYLHTTGTDGTFSDSNFVTLPTLGATGDVTVQSAGAPQYIDIGAAVSSLTLYYKSNQSGFETLIIADNNPLEPDLNLNDAMAILELTKPLEEDLLLELEEVVDETGRTVDHIDLTPTTVNLLPKGQQEFTAVAYDTEDKVITGLKFKWFVLIDKSGTIEKNGHSDSSKSTFTASTVLGNFYDDVMVATLYNGKIGYATATVKIADVVINKGPKHLPVTGMNGLQLVLLGLTLAAAVALAWVEHYDKTHFSGEK